MYGLSQLFPSTGILGSPVSWEVVPIFVIPGLLALAIILMPFTARLPGGHTLNVLLLAAMLAGAIGLSMYSLWKDRNDKDFAPRDWRRARQKPIAHGNWPAGRTESPSPAR